MAPDIAYDDSGTEIKVGALTIDGGEVMSISFDPEPGCACVVVLYSDDPGETVNEERWPLRQTYNRPDHVWVCDEITVA